MATGFIYIVTTLNRDYIQKHFRNVPTEWQKRLYFGPCKVPMRPKMQPGDYVFGISPAKPKPRRIVFVAQIEERLSFASAYKKFPALHGPAGPIHVRPVNRKDLKFPESKYQHIEDATHANRWKKDVKSPELDAFFVCYKGNGWLGRWLGKFGPKVDRKILDFLDSCSLYGPKGRIKDVYGEASLKNPIGHEGQYKGLHLETNHPEKLVELCAAYLSVHPADLDELKSKLPKVELTSKRTNQRFCDC